MVELEVLKKPLRQWTAQEVAATLNGVITRDEEERILHNDMRGSVVKDFCCVDFLIYVLHLSKDTAIKAYVDGATRNYVEIINSFSQNIEGRKKLTVELFVWHSLHSMRTSQTDNIMEILQPFLDESEDIDEGALLLDYCFQSKQRLSKNDAFTTVEESETKRHNFARVGRANGGSTRILNSTLKEQYEEEFALNAGGDEQMLEEDLNTRFEKLLNCDQRTFSVQSCETQEDELIHNVGVPTEYM